MGLLTEADSEIQVQKARSRHKPSERIGLPYITLKVTGCITSGNTHTRTHAQVQTHMLARTHPWHLTVSLRSIKVLFLNK